jgi:hypothetical protein
VSIREYLRQRRRKWTIVAVIGGILFAGGGFLCSQTNNPWLLPIPFLGFALFGIGQFARLFGLNCPKCGGAIGLATPYFGNPFGSDFRFCLACGISLETEYDDTKAI